MTGPIVVIIAIFVGYSAALLHEQWRTWLYRRAVKKRLSDFS